MSILWLEEVDSTNTYAKEHFDELADGTLVAARRQTSGRGRLNRVWYSEKGTAITATLVMKHISGGFAAGCVGGLAALLLVRECCPKAVSFLKWPNDVYIENAKVAGVLCEGLLRGGKLVGVVCGIGINVNSGFEALRRVGQPAVSLKTASGRTADFSIDLLTEKLEKLLAECYIKANLDLAFLRRCHQSENRLIGRKIQVISPTGKVIDGVFAGIGNDGEMLLESTGGLSVFHCGDVKVDLTGTDWDEMRQKMISDGTIES